MFLHQELLRNLAPFSSLMTTFYYIPSDVIAPISDKIISRALCRYVTNSFEIIFIFLRRIYNTQFS